MTLTKIFKALESISNEQGIKTKEESLLKLVTEFSATEEVLRIALNKDIYNVSSQTIIKALDYEEEVNYEDAGDRVFAVLSKLNLGTQEIELNGMKENIAELKTFRGNDSIHYLRAIYYSLCPLQAKWFTRIIMHNLRLGISQTTVNKVFKKLKLKQIEKDEPQLCGKFKTLEEAKEWLHDLYPIFVGIKYDGMRCIVEKIGNEVTMTSRQGKDIMYAPELIEVFKTFNFDFTVDGEIMSKNFSLLQKRIGRKGDNIEEDLDLHFRLFDILAYNGSVENFEQKDRRTLLLQLFDERHKMIKVEEVHLIENADELEAIYFMACKRKEEGIVIKLMDKPYVYGSREQWFKLKPFIENTFEVVAGHYGRGENANKIAIITIKDASGLVVSNAGSGLTESDKQYLSTLISKPLEEGFELSKRLFVDVKYAEITKNAEGKFSLRFPTILKFREDKSEADTVYIPYI